MTSHEDTETPTVVVTPEVFASLEKPKYRELQLMGYEVDDHIEDIEKYEPGGFCPVDLSLRGNPKFINNRYQVIYKLGFGGFGTVWLCYDTLEKVWRALKIHQARQSSSRRCPESRGDVLVSQMLEKDSVSVKETLDNGVVLPLDNFWIDSPNGQHLCSVLPVLGPRLSDLMDYMAGDDPGRINKMSFQIVKGMEFLHKHGICHGDFRPSNVLLKLKEGCFDDIGVDGMRRLLGRPVMKEIPLMAGGKSPHAPHFVYTCIDWSKLWQHVSDDIAVVDFGESYATSNPDPSDLGIPIRYAAPEILVGGDKSIGTDLWALGCTLLDLRCRGLPSILPHTTYHIKEMEDWMGPCPPPHRSHALQRFYENDLDTWKRQGEENGEPKPEPPPNAEASSNQPSTRITGKGSQRCVDNDERDECEDSIRRYLGGRQIGGLGDDGTLTHFRLTEEEITTFGDLLHKIFQWEPQARWNTARILGHKWFAPQQKLLEPNTDAPSETHINDDLHSATATKGSEGAPEPKLQASTDEALLLEKPCLRPYRCRCSKLCLGLQWLVLAFYLVGTLATLVYFVAYLVAKQPWFLERHGPAIQGENSATPLAVAIETAVVVYMGEE
ncbi:kinase-like domain-containing protein [Apiospora rasikravindrae]|uniref:EKC/KEOPS complex subunit BUD32 n=1 Tax=Apiospora rasikravindrae TaxID=990691 RepID=A0ABR1RXL8_9PEZI